jgi:hypothetical protein
MNIAEVPVAVDWCKIRPPGGVAKPLGERIADLIRSESVIGIMLHHAVMDEEDLRLLDDLFRLLRAYSRVKCVPMRSLLPGADEGDHYPRGIRAPIVRRLQSERMV